MDNIFKNKVKKEKSSVIDLKILVVLVTKLLKQDLSRLVKGIELIEL
jgi:hypothetical protein